MFQTVFPSIIRSTNCTYSVRNLSDRYCYLLLAAGSSNGLIHVERLTEINKFEKRCFLLVVLSELSLTVHAVLMPGTLL